MKPNPDFAQLCESFFTKRLMAQRKVSEHTISSYAHTFRLLTKFAQKRLGISPSKLSLAELNAPFLVEFLDDLETSRGNDARSRNARLAALRSFYHYAALEVPQHSGLIQRVLAIPYKRLARHLVDYLTRSEVEALLSVADKKTWIGRRNHAILLTAVQTGLRLSEITSLRQQDVSFGAGAHVRCQGKGRKERCTPLARSTVMVLNAWIEEQGREPSKFLFPNTRGERLSADAVQHLVAKYVAAARKVCPSLGNKRVTMELLQAGVDRSLIAIWLGHESLDTTQIYLDANLVLKEEILAKTRPVNSKPGRYKPDDQLLSFLKNL
jgi:integrase/recombinase XerD